MPLPICTRIPIDDEASEVYLVNNGWRNIEILETWVGQAPRYYLENIGLVFEDEIPDLMKIASEGFKHDRLHADPSVEKKQADGQKAKWIMDACNDPQRKVFVYRKPGPIGFLSVYLEWDGIVIIDLIAISSKYRHKGYAKKLVLHACHALSAKVIRAGTQECNVEAKLFYRSLGMNVAKRERTFHK